MRTRKISEWPSGCSSSQAELADRARITQLTSRTNQFDLSLRRRSPKEVRPLVLEDRVWVTEARGRFGSYGLVGICILSGREAESACLDTFLLSCWALGRGVEEAVVDALFGLASRMGLNNIHAPFTRGPRNRVILEFLTTHRFKALEGKQELEATASATMTLPEHILLEPRFDRYDAARVPDGAALTSASRLRFLILLENRK
jgi:predicted enzyme involved in methoxymalonyl-ACP biosynthesis